MTAFLFFFSGRSAAAVSGDGEALHWRGTTWMDSRSGGLHDGYHKPSGGHLGWPKKDGEK